MGTPSVSQDKPSQMPSPTSAATRPTVVRTPSRSGTAKICHSDRGVRCASRVVMWQAPFVATLWRSRSATEFERATPASRARDRGRSPGPRSSARRETAQMIFSGMPP